MASITFGGTTLYNDASTGVSFEFVPGVVLRNVGEQQMPLSNGVLFRDLGLKAATHQLRIVWKLSSPDDILDTLRSAQGHIRASMSVPDWGSFNRCTITDIAPGAPPKRVQGGDYLVEYTLTIRQSA